MSQSLSGKLGHTIPLSNEIFIISNYEQYSCQDNFSHEGYDYSNMAFYNFFKPQYLFTNENPSSLTDTTLIKIINHFLKTCYFKEVSVEFYLLLLGNTINDVRI